MSDSGRTLSRPEDTPEGKAIRLSNLRSKDLQVIAVLCADVHLSPTPPVWRSTEPDWYAAMARPLDFVSSLCKKYRCPLVIAGDIFDKWNPPPELINFAIRSFRSISCGVYAVPGQHDLPNHRYEDIGKSGYGTLREANRLHDLIPSIPYEFESNCCTVRLYGFPWRRPIIPIHPDSGVPGRLVNVAVVHDYCWAKGHSFPGCPEEKHVKEHAKNLTGYDAAVFGDNHKGFLWSGENSPHILNCGSLMRRNSDQYDFRPTVGLLKADGSINVEYVPCEEDKCLDHDMPVKREADRTVKEFIDILEGLGALTADFQEACKKFMRAKRVPDEVQRVVLACLEEGVIQK